MLSFRVLQPSFDTLCACRKPVRLLWPVPDTLSICQQLEKELFSNLKEMENRQHLVNLAHQLMSKETEGRGKPAENRMSLNKDTAQLRSEIPRGEAEKFQLSLDVSQFSPEELMVKTEGRKVIVMAKHEKKRQTEDGSCLHEYRELKREAELPEDVNPEAVLCVLSREGQLHIEAPRLALPAAKEKGIPIHISRSPEEGPGGHLSSEEKEPGKGKEQKTENQNEETENSPVLPDGTEELIH
ncbi:heat shock protein 30C-like [Microcaecilia unicolor]|uniref:Heat shock protein 30C-like n=1 Tax=Microcaecilia unicolor TaxID=1415580 RepID=A0A6P7WVA3_9AMPH|nr:heat shock protein 30C-like [Microcaecilia unicolor]